VHKFLFVFIFSLFTNLCNAQSFSFTGLPSVKISEGGVERIAEKIEPTKAQNISCVIKEVDGKFFWVSRENKQLVKIDARGAFLIFLAVDGSGYIRMIKPELKDAASLMSATEKSFDYIEHLLLGLRTVTYYGKSI
jgi:hypothetical protein